MTRSWATAAGPLKGRTPAGADTSPWATKGSTAGDTPPAGREQDGTLFAMGAEEANTEDTDGRRSDAAELAAAVRQLPEGSVIAWGDTHQRLADTVWRASWIDVCAPVLDQSLGWGWSWTVVTPEDGDAPQPGEASCTIALEPDCDVHTYIDETTGWYACDSHVQVTARGADPDPSFLASMEGKAACVVPGWSRHAVEGALTRWCRRQAGRDDLTFSFDDEIGMTHEDDLEALMHKAKNDRGQGVTYQIGEGIFATGPVMDALLEMDADEAAHVMRQIEHVLRPGEGRPGSTGIGY